MGLQLGLGFSSLRASGGGPAPSAPVIVTPGSIDAQPLVGQSILVTAPEFSGADSVSFALWDGDPVGGGAVIGGATETYVFVDADYGDTPHAVWTATNANGSTVAIYAAPAVVGKVYQSSFGDPPHVIGDDTTAFIGDGWSRNAANTIQAAIVAETDPAAVSGQALEFWATGAATRSFYPTAFYAWAAGAMTDPYEELFLFKHQTNAGRFNLRPPNGFVSAVSMGPGFTIRLGVLYCQMPGDDPNNAAGTSLGALSIGTYYGVRKRVVGANAKFKVWDLSLPEPATWDVTPPDHASPLENQGPGIGTIAGTASDKQRMLFVSCGYNAPAPYPDGYTAPPPATADLFTFAAASSVTEVTFADSAMVIALEDV